jgi:hypothetical protein
MSYRTAAILSVILIGGMFGLPTAVWAVFPSLGDFSTPAASNERILLALVNFCGRFRWFLALPIGMVLFTFAVFTSDSRAQVRR